MSENEMLEKNETIKETVSEKLETAKEAAEETADKTLEELEAENEKLRRELELMKEKTIKERIDWYIIAIEKGSKTINIRNMDLEGATEKNVRFCQMKKRLKGRFG